MTGLGWSIFSEIALLFAIVLAIGWLCVSFLPAGRSRAVVEWISTVAMYGVIASIMSRLVHGFWVDDRMILFGAVAFFLVIFGSGFLVSLVMTLRAAIGKDVGAGEGATH